MDIAHTFKVSADCFLADTVFVRKLDKRLFPFYVICYYL